MRWTFQIPIDLVSPNRGGNNRGRSYANRRHYKRTRNDAYYLICAYRERYQIGRATGMRRVTMTRVCGSRQRCWDEDNVVAACKPVFDALVDAGLLLDDDRTSVEREYPPDDTTTREHGPAVRITIEELRNGSDE